jgi:hypothetical protein
VGSDRARTSCLRTCEHLSITDPPCAAPVCLVKNDPNRIDHQFLKIATAYFVWRSTTREAAMAAFAKSWRRE